MQRILKYLIDVNDAVFHMLPDNAELLTVQNQNGEIFLWAKIDDSAIVRKRKFIVFGTGQPFDVVLRKYIGTVQVGIFVWHVFEETV